jgi:hypothetical protein
MNLVNSNIWIGLKRKINRNLYNKTEAKTKMSPTD